MPVGGKAKVIVSTFGAASETITLTAKNGKVFITETDATGKGGQLEIPVGIYTIKGSYSGYVKKILVSKTTTEVYAMPNGTIVYWYGYMPYTPVGKECAPNKSYFNPQPGITSNHKAMNLADAIHERSITFYQPGVSGTYCSTAVFENVKTDGGKLTFISTGKSANTSAAIVIFSYAEEISKGWFMPAGAAYVDYQQTKIALSDEVAAGTYDIAVSAQNNAYNYVGKTDVYAVYFEQPAGEGNLALEKQHLFDTGSINRVLTGGINGTVEDNALYYNNNSQAYGTNATFTTKGKIDLTNVNFIKARMMCKATKNHVYFRLVAIDSAQNGADKTLSTLEAYAPSTSPFNSEEREVTLDVSGITGKWYLGYSWGVLSDAKESRIINGYIYEWWIE